MPALTRSLPACSVAVLRLPLPLPLAGWLLLQADLPGALPAGQDRTYGLDLCMFVDEESGRRLADSEAALPPVCWLQSGREPSFGEKLGVFVCRPFNLIDLAAVLPFYIHLMLASFTVDLDFLRLLRMARVFRILKMAR